jgi:hypothetical protein
MTEIPEHLLKRARERRAALGLGDPRDGAPLIPEHLRERARAARERYAALSGSDTPDDPTRIPEHLLERARKARERALGRTAAESAQDTNPAPETFEAYQALLTAEVAKLKEKYEDQPLTGLALDSFAASLTAHTVLSPGMRRGKDDAMQAVWDYQGSVDQRHRERISQFYKKKVDGDHWRRPMQEGSLAMAQLWTKAAEQGCARDVRHRLDRTLFGQMTETFGVLKVMSTVVEDDGLAFLAVEQSASFEVHPHVADAIDSIDELLRAEDATSPAWHINHRQAAGRFGLPDYTDTLLSPAAYTAGARLMASAIHFTDDYTK